MYANADGKLMLFPKMHEGTEMWDYRYSSVLRKIRNTFRTGVPFKEMQDDCLTTDVRGFSYIIVELQILYSYSNLFGNNY